MAFDLLLSRGAHLDSFQGPPLPPPAKPRGLLARLFTKPPEVSVLPEQISHDAFHLIMSGAPAERRSDTTYFVRHRAGGDAWFAAELLPAGYIRLSASHGYHAFPRNFGDMLDMGLRLTALVRAQLYTTDGGEIVGADIGRMLAPDGPFVTRQIASYQAARVKVDGGMAPLEYPQAGVDLVPDYFVFDIAGVALTLAEVERELVGPQRQVIDRASGLLLGDPDGTPLVRLSRGDQWRVRSAWAAPFDIAAHATFDVVEELAALGGGRVSLGGRVVDDSLRAQIRKRCSGLGLDFAAWITDESIRKSIHK